MTSALQQNEIAGAALDVQDREPPKLTQPPYSLENVIVTPHIGGMSDIYPDQVLPNIKENLSRYLSGERSNLVNFVEWVK